MRPLRRLAVLALVPLFALLPASAATAQSGGDQNIAEAVNTTDGSSVFRLAFSVRRVHDGVVDQGNAAVAYASCESCSATAIALQVVFVFGTATTVTPENVAVAVNEECTECTTTALAYQFVFGVPEDFELEDDIRQIRDYERRIRELGEAGLAPEELRAQVDAVAAELSTFLRATVDAASIDEDDEDDEDDDEGDDEEGDDEDEVDQGPTSTTSTTSPTSTTAATGTTPTTAAAPRSSTTTTTRPSTTTSAPAGSTTSTSPPPTTATTATTSTTSTTSAPPTTGGPSSTTSTSAAR